MREFVYRGRDGLGSAQFGARPAIQVPEKRLAVMQRLRGHAERGGRSIPDFASFDRQHLLTADPVVRTEIQARMLGRPICDDMGSLRIGFVPASRPRRRANEYSPERDERTL